MCVYSCIFDIFYVGFIHVCGRKVLNPALLLSDVLAERASFFYEFDMNAQLVDNAHLKNIKDK